MATYAVTFNLAYNANYQERYQSLVAQIRACDKVWEETTSFALVSTTETLSALESRLYCKSDFTHVTDKMLVLHVSADTGIFRGVNNLPHTLGLLMPNVTQK